MEAALRTLEQSTIIFPALWPGRVLSEIHHLSGRCGAAGSEHADLPRAHIILLIDRPLAPRALALGNTLYLCAEADDDTFCRSEAAISRIRAQRFSTPSFSATSIMRRCGHGITISPKVRRHSCGTRYMSMSLYKVEHPSPDQKCITTSTTSGHTAHLTHLALLTLTTLDSNEE